MDLYCTSILCSNARAPVAHLVRATHWHSENPGSNPGAGSQGFFPTQTFVCIKKLQPSLVPWSRSKLNLNVLCLHVQKRRVAQKVAKSMEVSPTQTQDTYIG